MSITSDIRSYADSALEQGKQVVGQAQAQLNGVTAQANEFVTKLTGSAKTNEFVTKLTGTAKTNVSGLAGKLTGTATEAVADLRAQAEKAINLDTIKTAVQPYLAQVKQYRDTVTDRAEEIFESVKNDKRVAAVITTAESITGTVVESVNERLVKPVTALTEQLPIPIARRSAHQPTTAAAPVPAVTGPVATEAPAEPVAAKVTAAKATAAKATPRKAPAKKATPTS